MSRIFRAFVVLAALAAPVRLCAQVPTPTTSVIGVVVDSVSGVPVGAARVSLGFEGPAVATNALGRFQLSGVPLGTRRIVVSRLGYQDLEAIIEIADPMGGVQLRLQPDPLQLEGLSTKGATSGPLRGRVIDSETGDPVPYARITLTRDGVRQIGRRLRSTDSIGNFEIPDVDVGGYVLKVERPDYAGRLEVIRHEVPAPPLQVSITKDFRRTAALDDLLAKFDVRRALAQKSEVVLNERLQAGVMSTMDDFLMMEGPLNWGFDVLISDDGKRQLRAPPAIYIDGLPAAAPLSTYSPKEFYRIELMECRTTQTRYMLLYTYEYIENRLRNPGPEPTKLLCS